MEFWPLLYLQNHIFIDNLNMDDGNSESSTSEHKSADELAIPPGTKKKGVEMKRELKSLLNGIANNGPIPEFS